jgi:Ca2+/H+ antiporter
MELFLDICQGIGIACAAGIRPFLPTLAVGAFAAADLGVDFDGTKFDFLEQTPFLLVIVVGVILLVLAERRVGPERMEEGSLGAVIGAFGPALGALMFAGTLDDRHATWWPGIPAGVICALIAFAAIRALLVRVRTRLDADARGALPAYAEGIALLTAVLSVVVPPLGLVALGFLIALLVTGRRRAGQKYAGLRILR